MNKLKTYMLAALLLVATPFHSFAMDLTNIQKEVISPSVQLNNNCSATAVYSERAKESGKVLTLFLTAKHCLANSVDRIHEVSQPVYSDDNRIIEKRTLKVKVRGVSYKYDIAVLEAVNDRDIFAPVATLGDASTKVAMGTPVVVAGYPAGLVLTLTEGVFGSRESIPFPSASKDSEYFRATPNIMGGNSGGGLYAQINGTYRYIGIASAGLGQITHVGYYTPIDQIQEYLKVMLTNVPK
jgi:S1-C subfamily serine protease